MSRPVAVLRPQPGNAATLALLQDARLRGIALPLFTVSPFDWTPPVADCFDKLLLTSANAVRHGGSELAALRDLPVIAVGGATAAAARHAGFDVERSGTSDVSQLLSELGNTQRLLWLAGAERTAIAHPALAQVIAVYRAEPIDLAPGALADIRDGVALLHSSRAATYFAAAIDRDAIARDRVRLVAISEKVAVAAGGGWAAIQVAEAPTDEAMIAAARALAIDP